jgi:ABC-type antimicrobial peptide transport system ATPase subunit
VETFEESRMLGSLDKSLGIRVIGIIISGQGTLVAMSAGLLAETIAEVKTSDASG